MIISADKVVSIDYTLRSDAGEVLDTSSGAAPLEYLHGASNIIAGLEQALEGKITGDDFTVTIPPEEAYGVRTEDLVQVVSREVFDDVEELAVGMMFQVRDEDGGQVMTITAIDGADVTLDGNHPLAGQTLHFEISVKAVREATDEELRHGHPHSAGGCC